MKKKIKLSEKERFIVLYSVGLAVFLTGTTLFTDFIPPESKLSLSIAFMVIGFVSMIVALKKMEKEK
ncbi:MAG TPA: hypothetical protein ENG71_03245 [Thermoplasmatales archaeon]|nr:hypothetical protein [Thermoplasmatales archaeon]